MKTTLKKLFLCGFLVNSLLAAYGQDFYAPQRASWAEKAEQSIPRLTVTEKKPVALVNIVKDETAFQQYKAVQTAPINKLYDSSFKETKSVIVDFGEHITGSFSFSTDLLRAESDAPARFKLTFGEVPSELVTPFDPYQGGLSRAWLQDEVVTVMTMPATMTIPRRVSFRYVKIELIATPPGYDFCISGMKCDAVTSAVNTPEELSATTPQLFKDIDRVSLNTLKECMQTVYEDGPKRDQRLWLGDLYLEALANNYSFKQYDLTKRCLYLLASLSEHNGKLNATVFEAPEPKPQARQHLYDYSFLFGVTLKDYLLETGDRETAEDLWPVVKKQLESAYKYLQDDGMMNYEQASREWWIFFDWKDGLHREVAFHGVTIFAFREAYELAQLLNKENEVSQLPGLIKKMKKAVRKHYYNPKTGLFTGILNDQVSYASQIWMVLGEVPTQKEAQRALRALKTTENVCTPGAPYLFHYYIEALIKSGLKEEAKKEMAEYWGGMIHKGADTFWEVYDPRNEYLSPYNFYPVNSYCHAWSCTPTYFIRKYPEIFQK
ncbi:family 78 glycoside hydrolase catalytic domain [Parabacteroides faecis]|uniref:alpha-L-rhamnosidase-related protein n=1 Tax=Parabacteroides TaxID=375288 RepID=UPI000EFED99E|nr:MULTISPECIES: family 78 glycoside hydrolase catalytic domain [Parabacteroides]MBC8619485.1 family 78 glycoside hydrolase catalytic domain [Parabacteroides faecis]RHR97665.1 glycoside hydrolase [Parabacteroides sp. AF14-59]